MVTSTITVSGPALTETTIRINLTEQISKLRKKKWVNLQGLIDCSTAHLSQASAGSGPTCLSISLLGWGGFNTVYRLVFSDGTQLAASVPHRNEEYFDPRVKLSEIETMKFVRESGLYPDIPVPKVHTWDITFNNPMGAPYILMDVVEGENLAELKGEGHLHGLDTLSHAQQLSIVKTLARLQASLSRPVPFDKIGSITVNSATGRHSVGPLVDLSDEDLGGPFKSADELWRSRMEHVMQAALNEWCNLERDELPGSSWETKRTPQIFAELYQLLSSLIPLFRIPPAYTRLVLHHPDFALRNVFFDKKSLSSDQPKITSVIDWEGAQILPLILTARYPADLMTNASYPFNRSKHQEYYWHSVPVDWTSIGDPTRWPKVFYAVGKRLDHTPLITATVDRFYLRTYFSACYAEQLYLLHGDIDLAHATLFADAPYYLKFHETVAGGWDLWVEHARWIRETYWRLRTLPRQGTNEKLLILGPNVYRNSVQSVVQDLGLFEESASDNHDGLEYGLL